MALLVPSAARRGVGAVAVSAALVAGLAGPAAASIATAATAHTGAIPSASPVVSGGGFGGGPGGGGGGAAPGGGVRGAQGGPPGATGAGGPARGGTAGGAAPAGGTGGLLQGSTADAELSALLTNGADGYTWVAATVGSNSAAGYQLASGEPVMAIGGFNGSDPWPTLEVFQQYVSEGKIHYFIAGGGGFGGGGPVAAAPRRRVPSPAGSSRASRPRPSAASPCTT